MYEPLTVAKVRKETTVKVPAGGWIILGTPDQPLHAQIALRAGLVKNGNVNDDYSALLIGRLQDTHNPVKFSTKAEAADAKKQRAQEDKALAGHHADSLQRQKDQVAANDKAAQEKHAARVEEINRQNDAIRTRGGTIPALAESQPEIPPPETKAEPPAANEFTEAVLAVKNRDELLALAAELVKAGRLAALPEGPKAKLIAAILSAAPLTESPSA